MTKGHVIDGTPIAVNYWTQLRNCFVELFFLTHLSSDHTDGLTASWNKKIYTSNITAQLLKLQFPFLSSNIQALDFGTTHVLPLEFDDDCVAVTLFNANHCPGSVVLLFEGTFGSVLYTGDFRYYPEILPQIKLNRNSIDCLYFDNTYCSTHCNFPEKKVVLEDIMNHIKQYIGKVRIIIATDILGKEEMLIRLFNETKITTTVNPSRMATLDALNLGYLANTESKMKNTTLILIDKDEITGQKIKLWNGEMSTQVVVFTAKYVGAAVRPFRRHKNVHVFPYSSHSSFNELVEFVTEIKPKKLFPIFLEPLKNMFDTNQGSMESLNALVTCVKERIGEEGYSVECCLPQRANDMEGFISILLDMSSWYSDSCEEVEHSKTNVSVTETLNKPENPRSLSRNIVCAETENTDLNRKVYSNEVLKLDFPSQSRNRLKVRDMNVNSSKTSTVPKETPHFPDDLNTHFMSKDVHSSTSKELRFTSIKRKYSGCDTVFTSESNAHINHKTVCQNAEMIEKCSSPKCMKNLPIGTSQIETACTSITADGKLPDLFSTNAHNKDNPILDEIPRSFVSLIRKSQRKQLRTLKKTFPELGCVKEETFLNQNVSICYGTKGLQYTKLSISNKELLS